MRYKKHKPVGTPDGFKQSQITDYFRNRNSVSVVNRKLFDESAGSKMRNYKGKIMDSDDDVCDISAQKVILPYPLSSSDDERSSNSNRTTNTKKVKGKPVEPLDKDISNITTIELNKPSTSNATQEVIPIASSTPLKTNISCDGTLRGEQLSHSKNVTLLGNTEITPMKTQASAFGNEQSNDKDTFGTPSKRSRLDITLSESPTLKVPLDLWITITGGTQDISVSQNNTCIQNMKGASPASPQKPNVTLQTVRSPLKSPNKNKSNSPKKSPNKNESISPKLSQNRRRTFKKAVTFSSGIKLKAEGEDEKLNVTQLELLRKLFEETLKNKDKKELLTREDTEVIEEFLKLDVNHQYFLMKLFLYIPTWYNVLKFCMKIKLDQKLSEKDILTMYDYHKNNRFVYTDLTLLTTDELLNLLMVGDLRQIAANLKINKNKYGTKANIIQHLKQNCKTQSTLTIKKSSEDLLRDAAYKHLGYCIKLKEDIKSIFDKVYVLQTCCNFSYCMDVQNFLKDVSYDRVVYPQYSIEDYTVFKNKEQFSRFYESVGINKEFNNAWENKKHVTMKSLCDEAFRKLQTIDDDGKWKRHLPDHLQKLSAEYRYISLLKSGIKQLSSKHYKDVKNWLEFLIEHYPTNHAIGFWYKQLAHITLHNYKSYESAAQIVIEAFEFNKKENIFDLLQVYELNKIANKLRNTKSYKVCDLFCDKLADLTQLPVDPNIFKKKFIKGCTDRSGTPGKRIYSYRNSNNEVTYGSVENITLRHYLDVEEYEGIHCEGKFIAILFTLFFWDIIYDYYVPMTFISKFQSAPLDMYSDSFYENRKEEVNSRLEEISHGWNETKLETILKENLKNHAHERSITDFEGLDKDLNEILSMFRCIDRRVLSKILGRLVTNYKRFRSGLPDLFLWNVELAKSKFVEVKGENDTLQPNQILWIEYLTEVGADVEVCYVSGVGAKKISKEDEK